MANVYTWYMCDQKMFHRHYTTTNYRTKNTNSEDYSYFEMLNILDPRTEGMLLKSNARLSLNFH